MTTPSSPRLLQLRDIASETPMRINASIWRISNPVAIIPQIRPALVMSLPATSIRPVAISCKSLLPITQAAMQKNGRTTKLRIPNTRMRTPRCGFIRSLSRRTVAALSLKDEQAGPQSMFLQEEKSGAYSAGGVGATGLATRFFGFGFAIIAGLGFQKDGSVAAKSFST